MKRVHILNFKNIIGLLLAGGMILGNGCDKVDNSTNLSGVFVTVASINEGKSLKSDVVRDGYTQDDEVEVVLKSQLRTSPFENLPTEFDNTSTLDTIIFFRYHISHVRSDGGPNPPDFTAGITIELLPNDEKTAYVVVVRAFDKNRFPLQELWDRGQIFTTTTITFYGEDGYGNDVVVSGSFPISFANFVDSD